MPYIFPDYAVPFRNKYPHVEAIIRNAVPRVAVQQRHELLNSGVHYHPLTNDFIETLARPNAGMPALLSPKMQSEPGMDFAPGGAYSAYNWELFYHVPMLMANRLSQSQRFEAAQQWYHKVFDPTQGSSNGSADKLFWQFTIFQQTNVHSLQEMIQSLTGNAWQDWLDHPFLPHYVAKHRPQAYMMYTVMKYLDNLIAWADNLFRRDTLESINEATQLYILAAQILGPKPQRIPRTFKRPIESYNSLSQSPEPDDRIFNPEVTAPLIFPFANQQLQAGPEAQVALGMIDTPFFCVPPNQQILAYWDTVGDRLFKIRHCRNIEGVERQLALFDPPIDPRRLIEAAAAGVDIGSVVGDIYAPLPQYRFAYMLQKAQEFCNEVKAFGGALLSALEKKDAETLSLMRAKQENEMLKSALEVRELQVAEAQAAKEGLLQNRNSAKQRLLHSLRRLGEPAENVPDYQRDAPYSFNSRTPFSRAVMRESEGGIKLLHEEIEELNKLAHAATMHDLAGVIETTATTLKSIPQISLKPWGIGPEFGGISIGDILGSVAKAFSADATAKTNMANRLAKSANQILRQDDYIHQANQAGLEIMQIDRQLLANDLRIDIATKEKANHEKQIEHSETVLAFMQDKQQKFTQAALYQWMAGRLSELYYQCYRMAYDLAKQAERCYQYELGVESSNIVQFGYWDSNQKGLLAGERLHLALKQLEKAYLDQNRRELELTKHISLKLLNPYAILQLREAGKCDFAIPEELFDLDFPGHYFRRIKSVSISIPCVAGPYTTINATLRLKKSRIRTKANLDDGSLIDNFGGLQSIATSAGQNDSGLFELNFRDERYLPFEGTGAISEWTLEMMGPRELRQFDYDTIADAIIHLRYTAREDGALKENSLAHLKTIKERIGNVELSRMFSLRHDFPNEYHAWKSGENLSLELNLKQHFPYFVQKRGVADKFTAIGLLVNNGADNWLANAPILPAASVDKGSWTIKHGGAFQADAKDVYLLVKYELKLEPGDH